ncbi:MAG: MFS transporter, partial [Muribaculaceae bacterium]|nr:MFS transporter [Muribaculaceae bacterium]
LFGVFIMGFCDVVGISTSYVQHDFNLNETMAGFIPSMVFIWFLLLSLPSALLMNRIGRKNMVQLSNLITIAGMLIPFFSYTLVTCMAAFLLLGIGNTMLQVSLNPLLTNVVKGNALTSSLTAGQVIKAVSSFCGPFIAVFAVTCLGNWQYLFPIFAAITVLSALWLQFTAIHEEPAEKGSSIMASLKLLGDKRVCLLFLGIFFVVGVDVGTNIVAPKMLIERCAYAVQDAGYASSVYFVCRTAGAFIGTLFLTRVSGVTYFRINIIAAIASIALLFLAGSAAMIMCAVGLIGFFCSSIFSIIYSEALKANPEKENEISGLMIMGVFGGAVIPPAMGLCADAIGNQCGSLIIITISMLYLGVCAFRLKKA